MEAMEVLGNRVTDKMCDNIPQLFVTFRGLASFCRALTRVLTFKQRHRCLVCTWWDAGYTNEEESSWLVGTLVT